MRRYNQYAKGTVRNRRIPTIAVSETERDRIATMAKANHMSIAQLLRCTLVLGNVLETTSLDDIDPDIAEQISEGKPFARPTKAKP